MQPTDPMQPMQPTPPPPPPPHIQFNPRLMDQQSPWPAPGPSSPRPGQAKPSRRALLIGGVVAVLLACGLCTAGLAVVGKLAGYSTTPSAQSTPTPTPTPSPTPTPTPKPTPVVATVPQYTAVVVQNSGTLGNDYDQFATICQAYANGQTPTNKNSCITAGVQLSGDAQTFLDDLKALGKIPACLTKADTVLRAGLTLAVQGGQDAANGVTDSNATLIQGAGQELSQANTDFTTAAADLRATHC